MSAVRIAALVLVAACGWMAAAGIRPAGASWFPAVSVPWDVGRLPGTASEGRILFLRPTAPFARFRDASARYGAADPEEFRVAARGMLRWNRTQPGTLLETGAVAMRRWRAKGDPADREVGEALLVEFTARTRAAEGEGVRAWLETAGPADDPWPVFRRAPERTWAAVGLQVGTARPAAAWAFLGPSLADGSFPGFHAADVLAIARARREAGDAPVLLAFASRSDVAPEAARDLRALAAELGGPR